MRDIRQKEVADFVRKTWGNISQDSPHERALRLIEECIELAQSVDLPKSIISKMLDHVYDKPVGDYFQEAGGVGITLLAFCENLGFSASFAEQKEYERIINKSVRTLRARHNKKKKAGLTL